MNSGARRATSGIAVVDRRAPPDQVHDLLDQVGQAEGEQQLGHVAVLVHRAQAVALDQRAEHADQRAARCTSAGQKPT